MIMFEPFEVAKSVMVPGVGPMQRVELRSPDGELLEVHYRERSVASPARGEATRRREAVLV